MLSSDELKMLSTKEKSKVQRTAYQVINNLKSFQYLENRVVAETEFVIAKTKMTISVLLPKLSYIGPQRLSARITKLLTGINQET